MVILGLDDVPEVIGGFRIGPFPDPGGCIVARGAHGPTGIDLEIVEQDNLEGTDDEGVNVVRRQHRRVCREDAHGIEAPRNAFFSTA